MAPLQNPQNGRRGSHNNMFNTNRRRYSKRPNKQRHPEKDADGNVVMGGMGSATPSSPWGHQQLGGLQRGNRRRCYRQRRNSNQMRVQKSPNSPRSEPSFWEKVNWQPKDTPMKDAPAPPSWKQFSYANTNGLRTQIDMEGDVIMGEAPSLALSLLAELMSVVRLQ